jgi:hypothetical protein
MSQWAKVLNCLGHSTPTLSPRSEGIDISGGKIYIGSLLFKGPIERLKKKKSFETISRLCRQGVTLSVDMVSAECISLEFHICVLFHHKCVGSYHGTGFNYSEFFTAF